MRGSIENIMNIFTKERLMLHFSREACVVNTYYSPSNQQYYQCRCCNRNNYHTYIFYISLLTFFCLNVNTFFYKVEKFFD